MLKVAMVSEHASPLAVLGGVDAGGQNVHVAALAQAMAQQGAQVTVYTRRDARSLPARVEYAQGVMVEHVPAGPAKPIEKDHLLPHMGRFAEYLSRRWSNDRPDVVHAHFWMSGKAALDAGLPLGIPIVQTFHALGLEKRRHQGHKDTSPASRLDEERRIARDASRIVATASAEAFELVRMGADKTKIAVVPCGVDLSLFAPLGPAEARDPRRKRIVSLGRLVERKGIGEVITALTLLPDVELIVAGGPDASRLREDAEAMRLMRLAKDLGVGDRVTFRGRVERAHVPLLLRSADAVVCYPWYEPFGIVPLEAMACGVPVVVAQVGGLVDSVVNGVTGLHVPPRSPIALADALRELLSNPKHCMQLALGGTRRVNRRYGWARIASDTLAVYNDVIIERVFAQRAS
ncbi:MAG TPA: glycosyltransferase [Candidatus Baltobacteraceae bacterium]|jgi:glycosyltransferase involved in cell wall biosynthesis|nr:glycosyltransferase [Candidatus Baltobacteraceae bacterium]